VSRGDTLGAVNPSDPFGLIGQVLDGQFRVDKFVGEGGFSIVYRGHHAGLDEPIAIKCLKLPTTLGTALVDSFIRKFKDESRLHYRLSQGSLAIARSIGSGTTMSSTTSALVPYMVLEWLDGRSLAQDFEVRRVQGGEGRPLAEVVKLFDSAAQGLAFAHAQGVIHRDINPGNLFLAETRQGSMMKVLDFGVAKVISDHALELGPRAQTIGHIRIFAPAYGSPEQFDDSIGKIGPASDVYSFALIVLEALRDRSVREGEHLGEFAMMALDPNLRPTPRALGVPVGDAVEAAFAKATALSPADRPSDAGQFWGSLKHAIREDASSGCAPHADAVAAPATWKLHSPAAGQAPPDRPVTADMPAPVVEVSRPGSGAPGPMNPSQSQIARETVRMHTPPPADLVAQVQSAAAALGATPLSKATVIMGQQTQPILTPVPPTFRNDAPANAGLAKTAAMNVVPSPMASPFARSQDVPPQAAGAVGVSTFAMSTDEKQQAAIDGVRAAYGSVPVPPPPPPPVFGAPSPAAPVETPAVPLAEPDPQRTAQTVAPPKGPGGKGKWIALGVVAVLVLAALAVVAWFQMHPAAAPSSAAPAVSASAPVASATPSAHPNVPPRPTAPSATPPTPHHHP